MNKKTGYTYFLRREDDTGPVKIGFSKNPDLRLRSYLGWSPEPLKLLGYVISEVSLETALHRHLNDDRLHHEWFAWSDEVQRCVNGLIDGEISELDIPEAIPTPRPERRRDCEWSKSARSKIRRMRSISGRKPSCPYVTLFYRNSLRIDDFLPEFVGQIRSNVHAYLRNPVENGIRCNLPNGSVTCGDYKPLYKIYGGKEIEELRSAWIAGGPASPAYPDPFAHLEAVPSKAIA